MKTRIEIAEEIASKINGKVWVANRKKENTPVRIYMNNGNGYAVVEQNSDININQIKSASFMSVKAAIVESGYNPIR